VYGQWLPWLVYLDAAWVNTNVERIFSFTEDQRYFGEIAWNSYTVFCQAYDNVFDILRSQYERAVRELGPAAHGRGNSPDPREQLANHLIVYYWRGKLSLDDDLLRFFYSKAGPSLVRGSLKFIGRSLAQAPNIPKEASERLRSLWVWRLSTARSARSSKEYERELGAFAWWFRSAKFDNAWSVEELHKSLQLLWDTSHLTHLVIERLAAISDEMTLQCLECLRLLVERDSEEMTLAGWEGQARKILTAGTTAPEVHTREVAEDLIHVLGASGYLSFQDLLPHRAS
jgi:hypothetical protein